MTALYACPLQNMPRCDYSQKSSQKSGQKSDQKRFNKQFNFISSSCRHIEMMITPMINARSK